MTHRVVVAPDSFKGTIGAAAAAAALADGWRAVRHGDDIRLLPMADGGEGTVDAFATAVPGSRRMPVTVTGPDDSAIETSWLLLPDATAVVELASTSGIELLGARLRPLDADTRGFGEAIAAAVSHGVRRLVLGIGSSASTDGGTGLLSALGARFTDAAGRPIAPGGRGLAQVAAVDLSHLAPLPPGGVTVLSDVTNPLLGATGAAAVFGPQKGSDPDEAIVLDAGLARLAAVLNDALAGAGGVDPDSPGAGAAGGTGFGLLAWGAVLVQGATAVADLIGLAEAVAEASVVLTGEGSYDGQSAAGKVPAHVAALAARSRTAVALVAGRIAPDADISAFAGMVSLTELAGSGEAAMAHPARWLTEAGSQLARALG